MPEKMKGKAVVVTGGGQGIGRVLCRDFAREAANVVIADIDETGIRNQRRKCGMKKFTDLYAAILLMLILTSCSMAEPEQTIPRRPETVTASTVAAPVEKAVALINPDGGTVRDRINVPEGFTRIEPEENSFGHYLSTLPLKPDGSKIKLYNGDVRNTDFHTAVLDIDIGDRDLQQCADAVMRLRAEYLYEQEAFDRIHFNFTNGFKADFTRWMKGNSIKVCGNDAFWVENPASSGEYGSFRKYLEMVFAYAGTLSLSKEMKEVSVEEMKIGDVFIKGATPGHAVIVLDMAHNETTGENIFLVAQSYMPAQDIHILKNPGNDVLSPWYSTKFDDILETPQWDFDKSQLKRFVD